MAKNAKNDETRQPWDLEREELQVLADIGFIAFSCGFIDGAATIFNAISLHRPNSEITAVGRALVCMQQNRLETAVTILGTAPPTDAVRLFLGMALVRIGNKEAGRKILREIAHEADGTPFAELAGIQLTQDGEEAGNGELRDSNAADSVLGFLKASAPVKGSFMQKWKN